MSGCCCVRIALPDTQLHICWIFECANGVLIVRSCTRSRAVGAGLSYAALLLQISNYVGHFLSVRLLYETQALSNGSAKWPATFV